MRTCAASSIHVKCRSLRPAPEGPSTNTSLTSVSSVPSSCATWSSPRIMRGANEAAVVHVPNISVERPCSIAASRSVGSITSPSSARVSATPWLACSPVGAMSIAAMRGPSGSSATPVELSLHGSVAEETSLPSPDASAMSMPPPVPASPPNPGKRP